MATLFITVTDITKQELPQSKCHSGCMIIAIKGLCPGGNIDSKNDDVGYVSFIFTDRNGINNISSEQKKSKDNILLPFVQLCQKTCYGHDNNLPILDEVTGLC